MMSWTNYVLYYSNPEINISHALVRYAFIDFFEIILNYNYYMILYLQLFHVYINNSGYPILSESGYPYLIKREIR